ncbi:hypothetical protein Tco_1180588, partial [Tanacetum coccineum]
MLYVSSEKAYFEYRAFVLKSWEKFKSVKRKASNSVGSAINKQREEDCRERENSLREFQKIML